MISVLLTCGGMAILDHSGIYCNNYGMRSVKDTISVKLRELIKLKVIILFCRQMFQLLIVRGSHELKWLEC